MPRSAVIASLTLVLLLSGCAHFSTIDDFPPEFRQRLAEQPVWLTVTSFDNPRGVFPPAETSVVKKWESHRVGPGEVALKETASSSFVGLMESFRRGRDLREQVDIQDSVDPTVFFPYREHALERRRRFRSDHYVFRSLDKRRFEIEINGRGRIVFMPAPNNYFDASNRFGVRDVGIWTAPFGAEGELIAHLKKLIERDKQAYQERRKRAGEGKDAPVDDADPEADEEELPKELVPGAFLHHDVSIKARIPLIVDPSFPEGLRVSVGRAATKWNQALGKDLFATTPVVRPIEAGDCLSGRSLCIRWIGPPTLVFTGANGYTELAFDPETGLVVGGIITVINDDVQPPYQPLAAADRKKATELDPNWVADAILRYNEMNSVLHPEPARYIEYLVTHEMGHFNGLGHNFFTSARTTPERPISSVMSYPPYPVAHRANYIGDADMKRIEIVYGQKMPAGELAYCSTFDAMSPERSDLGFYKKTAACDMFTVGDAADWYIRLSDRGREGVFTQFPDLSNLSDDLQQLYRQLALRRRLPPFNLLSRLGYILADPLPSNAWRRTRVTTYLCGLSRQRSRIEEQLKTFHGITLACKR